MRLSKYIVTQSIKDQTRNQTGNQNLILLFNCLNSEFITLDEGQFEHIKNKDWNSLTQELFTFLKTKQFITDKSPIEETNQILDENITHQAKEDQLYIVIQPSAWCQMGCVYCGQNHTKNKTINVDHLIQFILKKLETKNYKELLVSWFGGEPLTEMSKLVNISTALKVICSEKNIEFNSKIVTNGLNLSLENYKILVEQAQCRQIEITLDGPSEFHDKRRPTKHNGNTFAVIYKNLLNVLTQTSEEKCQISIRCNVDDENQEGILPLLHQLHRDGLHKKISLFYLAPIHSWGNNADQRLKSIKQFSELEINIITELTHLGFRFNILPKRKKSLCLTTMKSGFLIDPSGEVFGCTEVSLVPYYDVNGENTHRIANISDSSIALLSNQNKFTHFNQDVSDKKFGCHDCFLLPICGGRCPKEWYEGRVPCPSLKYNINQRMVLKYLASRQLKTKEVIQK